MLSEMTNAFWNTTAYAFLNTITCAFYAFLAQKKKSIFVKSSKEASFGIYKWLKRK